MLRRSSRLMAVLCQDFPSARLLTLNREKALNALNTAMVEELYQHYRTNPHPNPNATIVLKGAGKKAFCAGGDVVSIVKDSPPGTQREFFYKEYLVNHHILTMPQTQVSLWDGIVMGGGVGVSVHGKFRVATEKALFAMPETGIGLFPDVGGSWFLPRLPNPSLGLFLALAGKRLKGADLVHAGIATHFAPSDSLDLLEDRLCNLPSGLTVPECLSSHSVAKDSLPPFSLTADLPLIGKAFKPEHSVETILAILLESGGELGKSWASNLRKCSPTALKVSLELFRRGRGITNPSDIFVMEYAATQRAVRQGDFAAGVTALLIEKTNKPVWSPATVEEVTAEMVASYFAPHTPGVPRWSPTTSYEDACKRAH